MTPDKWDLIAHLHHRAMFWDWPSETATLCRQAADLIGRQADAIDRAREVLDAVQVDETGRVRAHDLAGLAVLLEEK